MKIAHVIISGVFLLSFSLFTEAQDWSKGEIVDINGQKAIVFRVDEDGHGSAMSLKAFRGRKNAWTALQKKQITSLECLSEDDGLSNTKAIYQFVENNGLPLSAFPVFEWCKNLGEGWYIPSSKQMESFVNYWLGNDQSFNWDDDSVQTEGDNPKAINRKILDSGGIPFMSSMGGCAYTSSLDEQFRVRVFLYEASVKKAWWFKSMPIFSIDEGSTGRAFIDF